MSEANDLTADQKTNKSGAMKAAGPMALASLAGTFGQLMGASAQRRVDRTNQRLIEMQRTDAISRGKEAEKRLREGVKQAIGEQRTELAAQNVVLEGGDSTAANIQAETARLGEMDAMTIRNNARREAFGYLMQGISGETQSQLNASAAKQGAFASLLSGAGTTYATYRGLLDNKG